MDYIDKYDELKKLVTEEIEIDGKKYKMEEEFERFFIRGNRTAGTRIRKMMQLLRRTSESVRNDIQSYKKTL